MKSSLNFITFFSIKNSGKLSQTTAIINASHVQIGIHFDINASIIGIILVEFAYIGIHSTTAIGTAKGLELDICFSKNHVGTNQWIIAQIHTHNIT